MNELSKNVCHDLHEGKEVIDILLNSMQKGDMITIQRGEAEFEVKLLGERDGG